MLDPQVQIRIIDLAAKWVEETRQILPTDTTQKTIIEKRAERFDQAYKAIVKTVTLE